MLEHGGNLAEASRLYRIPLADWLDLSTGINPHAYPVPDIPPALWNALPQEEDGLAEAAAIYYQAPAVLPVAGSQAAIQTLPRLRPTCRVAVLGPTYAEHAHAWLQQGHQVQTLDALPTAAQLQSTDVLIVCNPNNPTARLLPTEVLQEWHAELKKRNGWLVVDEAFMDAVNKHSMGANTAQSGLIVLRSLGKFFGLAGARVGFVAAHPSFLDQLRERLGPWPISQPSRWIARRAMQDIVWQQQMRSDLANTQHRLSELLKSYGLMPTASNPLFQYVETQDAVAIHRHFAERGIWLRLFTQPSALRFGLPTDDGWLRLEDALRQLR